MGASASSRESANALPPSESAVQSVSAGNAPAPTGPPPSSAMQSAFAKGFDERAARRQAAFEGPSPVVHVEGLPTQSDAPLRAAPPPISLRKAASQQSLLSRTWSAIFGKAKPTAAPIAPADDNSPDSPPQQQMSPEKKPDAQLPSRNLRSKHKRDLEAEAETKEEPKPTPVYGRRRDSFERREALAGRSSFEGRSGYDGGYPSPSDFEHDPSLATNARETRPHQQPPWWQTQQQQQQQQQQPPPPGYRDSNLNGGFRDSGSYRDRRSDPGPHPRGGAQPGPQGYGPPPANGGYGNRSSSYDSAPYDPGYGAPPSQQQQYWSSQQQQHRPPHQQQPPQQQHWSPYDNQPQHPPHQQQWSSPPPRQRGQQHRSPHQQQWSSSPQQQQQQHWSLQQPPQQQQHWSPQQQVQRPPPQQGYYASPQGYHGAQPERGYGASPQPPPHGAHGYRAQRPSRDRDGGSGGYGHSAYGGGGGGGYDQQQYYQQQQYYDQNAAPQAQHWPQPDPPMAATG